jgi:hypothetical protein
VKFDRYWFNDTNSDRGWDAVWDGAATRDASGWHAEFRIPFSQLRFKAGATGSLGFAIARTTAHLNEVSTWPLLARSASGYVSSFGELDGVAARATGKRLELMPYVSSQVATIPGADVSPLKASPDPGLSAGLDLKYRVAPGLTLTATMNPDFGQVEADPAVVNLGAFETVQSERRPFFVEGSGSFSFGNVFYSRRIGRAPQRSVDTPEDGYVAAPANSTILGAAKLTGRVGAFSIGVLNAVTAAEHARVLPAAGAVESTPVEPAASYTVVRVNREFANKSRVGVIATATNRALRDELMFLPSSAFVAGTDADWRFGQDRYSVFGTWVGSVLHGTADAIDRIQRSNVHSFQRPDATNLAYDANRTSLGGHSGSLSFNKIAGERTRFEFNGGFRSPGFDVNDLGFQSRADEIWHNGWFQIRNERTRKHLRSTYLNFNYWTAWNFGGDLRDGGANVNMHWVWKNNWSAGSGFNVNARRINDRLTRGGPAGFVDGNVNQWGYVDGDNRKPVFLHFFGSWLDARDGSWQWSVEPGITVRPSTALSVNVQLNFDRNVGDAQWIENLEEEGAATRYVFGRIDQTTASVSMRVNYTIRPTLSLQLYARPFVSAGDYSDFRELVDGRAPGYGNRYRSFAYADDPDFNVQSLRTTNVLRWEYRPGSALFIVWQQGREADRERGDFRFGRDVGGALTAPASNVFLIKISRWMNF